MDERPQDEPDYNAIPEPPSDLPPPDHIEYRVLTFIKRAFAFVIGPARALTDPQLFHKISLAAFLAWVGLGADGLSSSAYGPGRRVPRAPRQHLPRDSTRHPHRDHGRGDRLELHADHRALPRGRRRLRGGHETVGAKRGAGIGKRAPRRLRAHGRHLAGRVLGVDLQLGSSDAPLRVPAVHVLAARNPDGAEPARSAGVGRGHLADLPLCSC